MKKWIFIALAGLTFGLVGCSEDDNLSTARGDGATVTIYSYSAPGGDPDTDIRLRIIPNKNCTSFYLLSQLKLEKDQYTESEYREVIMDSGTEYDAAEEFDQVLTGMNDTYAITVLPMQGNAFGKPVEYIFNGSSWTTLATVTVTQDQITGQNQTTGQPVLMPLECELQKNDKEENLYRVFQILNFPAPNTIPDGSGVPFYLTPAPEYNPDGAPVGTYQLGDATGIIQGGGVLGFMWNPEDPTFGGNMRFTREGNIYKLSGGFTNNGVAIGIINITMDLTPLVE